MPNLLLSLRIAGLASILIVGVGLANVKADDGCSSKNPLRGVWSLSQNVPYVLVPGFPDPFPITNIGNLIMDGCGNFTGKATSNGPSFVQPFDYFGSCGNPDDDNGLFDCSVNSTQLGIVDGSRACVASARRGECFNRMSCVISNAAAEPGVVLIAEFTRQKSDTCQ